MPVATLLDGLPEWSRATEHRFLASVRDGTLPAAAFDAWLVQDHHFVGDLLWFQARLLARAPRAAHRVLAAGVTGLVQELDAFQVLAAERGLGLEDRRSPATVAYGDLLVGVDALPAEQALVALWAVERAYLDAWSYAAPGAPAYRPMVAHWTAPAFAAYVADLQAAADAADPEVGGPIRDLVKQVAVAESAFWDMAIAAAR
jgi:thiaminase/transcriptional activator TenA